MQGTTQNYTLDMADGTAPKPLIVKQGDTNSRWARISLVAFKEPWTIPFGAQIHINVRKKDMTYANATCTQEDEHTVLAPITEQMTTVPGTQLGELFFLGTDGDIRSQTFPLVVWDAVSDLDLEASSNDFQALKAALRDVKFSTDAAGIATQYATEQGNAAGMAAQRAEDAADSIQVAVDAAANAKVCESNARDSELAAAQTQQEVTDYVESQKAAFVGYSKRESDSRYANAITATAEGEGGVTVGDAWTAPVIGLEVAGKSEQVQTTGAQLLDNSRYIIKTETVINGIRLTPDHKGAFIANGVAISEAVFQPLDTKTYVTVPKGTYFLSGCPAGGTRQTYFIQAKNVELDSELGIDVGNGVLINLSSETKIRFNIRFSSGANVNNLVFRPMLNAGSTALPYEPYTGGAPSPSPDYPQDIISTGTVSTGAQLLDLPNGTDTIKGLNYTFNNGEIKVTGTPTIQYAVIYWVRLTLTPGDYYISGGNDSAGNMYAKVSIDKDGSTQNYVNRSFSVIGDETAIALTIQSGASTEPVSYTFKPMLNAGGQPLPWEPYTGGKPAPSVEYPQTLEVTATGRNLYDPTKTATATHNGTINKIENDEIYFTASGADSFFGDATTKGGRYQPQFGDMQTIKGARIRVIVTNKWFDKNYITFWDTSGVSLGYTATLDVTVEVPKDAVAYTIRCGHTEQSTETQSTKIQVQYDSENVDYEPYRSASAPITLTEPLRGIGDYRDRIMCRDGEWGVERWCQADIFDGSADEAWIMYSQEIRDRYYIIIKNAVHTETSSVLCDKAIGKLSGKGNAYTELNTIWLQSTPEYRRLYLNFAADDVEKLHEELQMNPLTVIYPLDTPTWEPFDDATQQALNELTTYSGTTHLTITAGGTAPTVTLDYVKDTHKALEQCQEAAKEYTDNQIATIVAALPTATQAAIVDTQTSTLLKEVERL